jgi:vitamin B12 transporter
MSPANSNFPPVGRKEVSMSTTPSRLSAAVILIASATTALAQPAASPDIVVTSTRTPQPIQRAGSAITVIPAEEIEKASVKSVEELFRQVPGVTLTQSGGPGQIQTVRIRGGDVRHTLVLIDGIRVNDPSTAGREFDFATLVLADIERIEVLRGPQSALYGSDAMGGVINIITKRGRGTPRATLSVEGGSYGTMEARGAVSGGNERVDYSFGVAGFDTAGFSAFGHRIPRLRAFAPRDGFEADSAQRVGATGRVGVRLADEVRVEVGGGTNQNWAQYDAAFLPFPDTDSRATNILHNGYGRVIADTFGVLRNTATVYANRTDRSFRDEFLGEFGSRSRTEFIGDRAGAEYQGDLALGSFGLLTFGGKGERESADSFMQTFVPVPTPRQRTIAAEQTTQSAFALHQVTLGERLHLSLGGRVDDVIDVDQFNTWRATAAYEIPETETKLRASAGTGGKAPSLFQLFSPSFGTATLESERSFGADAGIDQMLFNSRVKLSATAFHNRYRDLIDFNFNAADCAPGQVFGCFFNVARARTNGFELANEVVVVQDYARLRVTYTWLDAVDEATKLKLARRPEHQGRVGLVLTPHPRLSLEPRVVFVGERWDLPNETGRLPPYARLDMYADYKFNDTFSLYARAENLTDVRYEEVRNFGTAGRSFYGGMRATW